MPNKMNINNLVGKYFGPDKIEDVKDSDNKTYLGNPMVILVLEGGKIEKEISEEMAKSASTTDPTDLTQLRDLVVCPLVEKIMGLVVDSGLTVEDTQYAVGSKLELSLNDAIDRASSKLWGKPKNTVTFADMEAILTKNDDGNTDKKTTQSEDKSSS